MTKVQAKVIELEDMLKFVMSVCQLQAAMPTGIIGADGKPAVKVMRGSLLDFYQAQKSGQFQIIKSSDADMPPQVKEDGTATEN